MLHELLRRVIKEGGFLTLDDVDAIVEHDRLRLILVRCGCGRVMCPAQDVRWFCDMVKRDDQDYVRDVSLPAGDSAWPR